MTSRMSKGRRVSFGMMPYRSSAGYTGSRGGATATGRVFLRLRLATMSRAISSACAVVLGEVVGDAGHAGVHFGAAQGFGIDDFAGRGLHQRRAAEEDRALVRAR